VRVDGGDRAVGGEGGRLAATGSGEVSILELRALHVRWGVDRSVAAAAEEQIPFGSIVEESHAPAHGHLRVALGRPREAEPWREEVTVVVETAWRSSGHAEHFGVVAVGDA